MLDPKTLDWSDSPLEITYETQLENFKKKENSLNTTIQYSENASTSEEGNSATSPWLSSSSKFNFQSNNKTIKEKIEQIYNLHGSVVFLNVFDLTADITGADFIQFYDSLSITSIIKYPSSTMMDLEFSCKADAIKAIEKGVGMIKGCLFSVRISKRNYNPNVYMSPSRQRKTEAERYMFYAKKETEEVGSFIKDGSLLLTYTKKSNSQAIEENTQVPQAQSQAQAEVEQPKSLQTINETNREEALKVHSIDMSETESETSVSQARTIDILSESLMSSPQVDLGRSVSMNMTSPQPKKVGSNLASRTPPMKVGKYRNIVRSSGSKTQVACQPSAEEMEKVNKLQRQLIDQFLQEKEAAERREYERIQREKEEQAERERIQREKEEQLERERMEREDEESRQRESEEKERLEREEQERVERLERERKAEEEASKPVKKEVYEKIVYSNTSYRSNYRDNGYYRSNKYNSYDNDYKYSRGSGYRFATVEKEYTAKKNF